MNITVRLSKEEIKTIIRLSLLKDFDVKSDNDITFSTMSGELHETVVECKPKKTYSSGDFDK